MLKQQERWLQTVSNVVGCYWLSHIQLFGIPWTVAHQIPLSMEFCKQDYWSGLPFPSPVSLPDPRIEPASPALAGSFFTTESGRDF